METGDFTFIIYIYTFILLNYLKQHLLAITISTQLSTIMTLSTEKLDILLTEFASRKDKKHQISQVFLFFYFCSLSAYVFSLIFLNLDQVRTSSVEFAKFYFLWFLLRWKLTFK